MAVGRVLIAVTNVYNGYSAVCTSGVQQATKPVIFGVETGVFGVA